MPTRRDVICSGAALIGLPAIARLANAATTEPVAAIANDLLAQLEDTRAYVRLRSGLQVRQFDDMGFEAVQREAAFNRSMLDRVNQALQSDLPYESWLLAGTLRQRFATRARADEDYWFEFSVTPYGGGTAVSGMHRIFASQPLRTADDLENHRHLLESYVARIQGMAVKVRSQAQRGIRVPRPAIESVLATLKGLKGFAIATLPVPISRLEGLPPGSVSAFQSAVEKQVAEVASAYDRVTALFDDDYRAAAPVGVGMSQYPGGADCYVRAIAGYTGLTLSPEKIHERGVAAVAELEEQMQAVRDKVHFKGDRDQFHEMLRRDSRFIARTPAEIGDCYLRHMRRIEPEIPRYFSKLPRAGYSVKRLDPAAEAGMTYGYYESPTPLDPTGYYRYNASELGSRSLVTAAHLIYHELVPGHHFHVALEQENTQAHPVRQYLSNGAFNEGWAEYAANLAIEMGALEDPYDRYGHLIMQSFVAARLVVDTGMNSLGWSLERGRDYLKAHTFESDTQIATESLRYSTDIPAQALSYRLGYEKFSELRRRAQQTLGTQFDIREFHAAIISNAGMPLDVLDEHIQRFIRGGSR